MPIGARHFFWRGEKWAQLRPRELTGKGNPISAGLSCSPIVLEIDVNKALEDGVRFYTTGSHVWFCDAVGSNCLKIARQAI